MDSSRNGSESIGVNGVRDELPDGSGKAQTVLGSGNEAPDRSDRKSNRKGRTGARSGGDDPDVRLVQSPVEILEAKARNKTIAKPYDPDTAEACPLFWELVTLDRYPKNDKDRLLPEIRLSRIDGGWLAILQDIETGYETRFEFTAMLDLARAAEKALGSGKTVWKAFMNHKNKKGIERHDKKS